MPASHDSPTVSPRLDQHHAKCLRRLLASQGVIHKNPQAPEDIERHEEGKIRADVDAIEILLFHNQII